MLAIVGGYVIVPGRVPILDTPPKTNMESPKIAIIERSYILKTIILDIYVRFPRGYHHCHAKIPPCGQVEMAPSIGTRWCTVMALRTCRKMSRRMVKLTVWNVGQSSQNWTNVKRTPLKDATNMAGWKKHPAFKWEIHLHIIVFPVSCQFSGV